MHTRMQLVLWQICMSTLIGFCAYESLEEDVEVDNEDQNRGQFSSNALLQ